MQVQSAKAADETFYQFPFIKTKIPIIQNCNMSWTFVSWLTLYLTVAEAYINIGIGSRFLVVLDEPAH